MEQVLGLQFTSIIFLQDWKTSEVSCTESSEALKVPSYTLWIGHPLTQWFQSKIDHFLFLLSFFGVGGWVPVGGWGKGCHIILLQITHTHTHTALFRLFVPNNTDPGVHICLQKANLFIDLHYVQVLLIKKTSDMTVKCTVITIFFSSSQKLIHQLKQKPKNKQTQNPNPILNINYVCVCMQVCLLINQSTVMYNSIIKHGKTSTSETVVKSRKI